MVTTKPISLKSTGMNLSEIDMECVSATYGDLQEILKNSPELKYLRHYQLVKALYESHVENWKKGQPLPKYKLKNLDADFSHVVSKQSCNANKFKRDFASLKGNCDVSLLLLNGAVPNKSCDRSRIHTISQITGVG